MTYEEAKKIVKEDLLDGVHYPMNTFMEASSIISNEEFQEMLNQYLANKEKKKPMKKEGKLTHYQLCELAGRFLKHVQHYNKILIETGYRKENPDAFGIDKYGSTLIECKASRSDFLADKKKPFRINPSYGIGMTRFYLVNEGVIKKEDDVPPGWQVLVAKDENTIEAYTNFYCYKPSYTPKELCFEERNFEAELELLWSWFYREEHGCLPTIGDAPKMDFVFHKWKQRNEAE